MRRQDVHREGHLVTVRRGARCATPHPDTRVVHPRVDRAVLADLVSQSMDIVEPRQVSDEQSDITTTQNLEDGFPALPTACVHQYAVPLG